MLDNNGFSDSAHKTVLVPNKLKDILIGKGEDRRDRTHFHVSYAFAWAD